VRKKGRRVHKKYKTQIMLTLIAVGSKMMGYKIYIHYSFPNKESSFPNEESNFPNKESTIKTITNLLYIN